MSIVKKEYIKIRGEKFFFLFPPFNQSTLELFRSCPFPDTQLMSGKGGGGGKEEEEEEKEEELEHLIQGERRGRTRLALAAMEAAIPQSA